MNKRRNYVKEEEKHKTKKKKEKRPSRFLRVRRVFSH